VPVELRVEAEEPATALDDYDHVAEASIDIPSGRLVIAGNSDYWPDAPRIDLAPGSYRVRVLYRGLATVSDDGLAGDDSYALVLWPGQPAPVRVLKRYERAQSIGMRARQSATASSRRATGIFDYPKCVRGHRLRRPLTALAGNATRHRLRSLGYEPTAVQLRCRFDDADGAAHPI